MDAVKLLMADHKEVKSLFKQYEDLGEKAQTKKKAISNKIILELKVHTQIEEEIFYPRVREATQSEKIKKLLNESVEEHHIVKILMSELEERNSVDEVYDAKMTVLKESVDHHVKEEHEDLFPGAKKALDKNELEELGDEMKQRKEELKKAKK